MTRHTIWDNEIKMIKDASDVLFSPQPDGKSDPRTAYQTIHSVLEDIKMRCY
jgi:hypothetical protein